MSNQKNIAKLSELHEQALALIKQYNEIAETENYETRIGIIDATFEISDLKYEMAVAASENGEEPSEELIDSMVVDMNDVLKNRESPYWSTRFPSVKEYCWKPSSLNC